MENKSYSDYLERLYNQFFPNDEESFKVSVYREYLKSASTRPITPSDTNRR